MRDKQLEKVVFVRSIMPRSGTNFMADALSFHHGVSRFPGQFWEFTPFRQQKFLNRYLERIENSLHAPSFKAKDFLPHLGKAWLSYFENDVDVGERPLFKEPSIEYLDEMFMMFPDAKTVILIRDGRDVIESLLKAGFGLPKPSLTNIHHWRLFMPDEDFKVLCRRFRAAVEALKDFLENGGTRKADSILIVRFEELFSSSETVIRKVLEWLELPENDYDWEALKSMPVRGSSFLRNPNGSMNFETGIPLSGNFNPVGRWSEWSNGRKTFYQKYVGIYWDELVEMLNEYLFM